MFGGTGTGRQPKQARFKSVETNKQKHREPAYQLTAPANKSDIGVLFEPVYKRMGHRFIPASHKAVVVIDNGDTPIIMGQPLVAMAGIPLLRAMKSGYLQHEIISVQLSAFLRCFQGTEKLSLELDIFDLTQNADHFEKIVELLKSAEERGLPAKQIIVEFNASPSIDLTILMASVSRLKQLGVGITLGNMDADCFSFRRIFKVQPLAVKFNRSWSDEGRADESFQRMFKGIIETLHSMGCYAGMTGVESAADLTYAHSCGLTRCQGTYFGAPTTRLVRGQVYTV